MNRTRRLQKRIGHKFRDPALLERALTHSSNTAETGSLSNERLEFLGDAILSACVVTRLHAMDPELSEAVMSEARSLTVRAEALGEVGIEHGLGDNLRLGKGEQMQGGGSNPRLAGNAVEAVIGATYLDGGIDAAQALVDRWLGDRLAQAVSQLTPHATPAS